MLRRVYQSLIDRLSGGEPWTYITRRAARERPLEVVLVAFFLGVASANFMTWQQEIVAFGFALAGIVVGHIYWGGKRYRK